MAIINLLAGEQAIRARLISLETAGIARICPTPDIEPFSGYIVQIFISEFPSQRPSIATYHASFVQEMTVGFTVNVFYKELRAHDGAWNIISQVRERLLGFRAFGPQPFLSPPAYDGLWQSDGRFVAGRGDSAQWVYSMKFNASIAEQIPHPFDS